MTFTVGATATRARRRALEPRVQRVQGAANPAAKSLTLDNTGNGTLDWTVAGDASWLTVTPGAGTDAGTVGVSGGRRRAGARHAHRERHRVLERRCSSHVPGAR